MDKRHSIPCVCLLALAATACGRPHAESQIAAHARAVDPPQLWRAEALDTEGRVTKAIQVCANRDVSAGFSRGNAEVNGQTCAPRKDAVERDGFYAVRCEVNGRPFGLTVTRTGAGDDFTMRMTVKALYGPDAAAVSVRHYQRQGPCPAGWAVGDQGPAGAATRPATRSPASGTAEQSTGRAGFASLPRKDEGERLWPSRSWSRTCRSWIRTTTSGTGGATRPPRRRSTRS